MESQRKHAASATPPGATLQHRGPQKKELGWPGLIPISNGWALTAQMTRGCSGKPRTSVPAAVSGLPAQALGNCGAGHGPWLNRHDRRRDHPAGEMAAQRPCRCQSRLNPAEPLAPRLTQKGLAKCFPSRLPTGAAITAVRATRVTIQFFAGEIAPHGPTHPPGRPAASSEL